MVTKEGTQEHNIYQLDEQGPCEVRQLCARAVVWHCSLWVFFCVSCLAAGLWLCFCISQSALCRAQFILTPGAQHL